jgi:tetratricopeptide (TPR) repeat protein
MARQASVYRLDPRRRLEAHFVTIRLYSTWAEWALQNGLRRSGSTSAQRPSGNGREDFETAIWASDLGLGEVLRLEGACPSYVGIGWEWCNLAEVREQASNGLSPETGPPAYPDRAHAALIREHQRNPFEPAVAGRLLWLPPTQSQPLPEQLKVITPCLRAGTLDEGLQDAIRQLSLRDGFDGHFAPLLKSADRVNPSHAPKTWTPAYAPEIQWIAAIVLQQQGHYPEAANLLKRSLHLGERLNDMFPYRRSAMESHLAAILFLAEADHVEEALSYAESAQQHLPAKPSRFVPKDRIVQLLIGLDLARGDESSARDRLRSSSEGPPSDERTDQRLAGGYLQIAQQAARSGADPERVNLARRWLIRGAALAPKNAEIHRLAGMLAMEAGDADGVLAALSALISSSADARIVNQLAAQVRARFPGHEPLAQWFADHLGAPAATQPQD